MKGVIVKFAAPKVTINGHCFECLISPIELYAKARRYMAQLIQMDTLDEKQVRNTIVDGCDIVEDALGKGAMVKIADGKPVSLTAVIAALNAIVSASGEAYSGYIRREYGGDR